MASFALELETSSIRSLFKLLDVYFVRDHQGNSYSGPPENEPIIQFIEAWLQPEDEIVVENNFLQAVQDGVAFNSNLVRGDLINQIFDPSVTSMNVSPDILDDFAKYPMREAFGYNPWDLLQGYIRADSPEQYFQEITKENPNAFLNHTERIFYLTRGYGRPNKYISPSDLQLRVFLTISAPTSLLILMDLFGICPTIQNPNIVREHLSGLNLKTIPKFYRNAIARVNECLGMAQLSLSNLAAITSNQPICDVQATIGLIESNVQSCDANKVECFREFLKRIGMLDIAEYDPKYNVFISNLSQMGLYENVIPEKQYSFEEIVDMPDVFVASMVQQLPDNQILSIQVPSGPRLADQIDLTNLDSRLRSNLVRQALIFLNRPTYYLLSQDSLVYGRLADSELDQMTLAELEDSVERHGALIDPFGNVMHLETAKVLNQTLNSATLRDIINKTEQRMLENQRYISQLNPEFRRAIKLTLNDLALNDSGYSVDQLQDVLEELREDSENDVFNLILWSNSGDWSPVSMDFETYFQQWSPLYPNLIRSTVKYYIQVL